MEKILKTGVIKDKNYSYFIDKQGDVSRTLKHHSNKSAVKKVAREQLKELIKEKNIKGNLKKKMQDDFKIVLGEL